MVDVQCAITSSQRHNNFLWMLEKAQNVIVHDESEDDQDEDESDLNKSFLGLDAEIVTERAFDGKHGDVAAVEDGKWKQIYDSEIQADERHHGH